ncbi:sialate O-acetylesterase [Vibrio parahaemolyticus]
MNSNNFFQQIAEFQKNIDWLNQVLKGGKDDSVIIDGVTKPSISKDIDNQYSAIKSMVQGRQAYETKADLPSSPPNGVILCEVWRDQVRENNGLYGWNGSAWEKSPYDSTQEFVNMVDGVRAELGDANTSHQGAGLSSGIEPIETNHGDKYSGGISDEFGRMIMAFGLDGVIKIFTQLAIGFADFKAEKGRAGLSINNGELQLGVSAGGTPFVGNTDVHSTDNLSYAIMDQTGRMAFIIYSDGTIQTAGQQLSPSTDEYAWSVQDKDGRVALMVLPDGTVDFIPNEKLIEKIIPSSLGEFNPMLTDHNHILMHGQSLSVGLASRPAITGESGIGALMPDSGTYDGVRDVSQGVNGGPPVSTGYSPMMTLGDASMGNEVPTAGACEQLQLMLNERFGSGQHVVIGSNCGHGGYKIDQLDKEGDGSGVTPNYTLGVEQSQLYKRHSSGLDKHCLTQAMLWMQGESDIWDGTSKEEYKRRFKNLIMDFSSDINQSYQPVLLTYQVGSHTKCGDIASPDIPIAQWEVSKEHPYIKMACPTYILDYNSDGIHLKNHSSRWIGCYFGKALFKLLTDGEWKPLQPERINRQGNIILIDMHVPVPPLVIDQEAVLDPGDYGFEVWNGSKKEKIKSISLVGDSKIKIVLESDVIGKVIVRYGIGTKGSNAGPQTGPRGNIRDSDPTMSALRDADNKPYSLFNWCVIFEKEQD